LRSLLPSSSFFTLPVVAAIATAVSKDSKIAKVAAHLNQGFLGTQVISAPEGSPKADFQPTPMKKARNKTSPDVHFLILFYCSCAATCSP
jgi:hypothetical protein